MKITISGSYRKHMSAITRVREKALALGIEVLRPKTSEILSGSNSQENWVRLKGDPLNQEDAQRLQFEAIRNSDALYVVNPGGYIGGSALAECGYAHALGLPIWFMERPYEDVAMAMYEGVGEIQLLLHGEQQGAAADIDKKLVEEWLSGRRQSSIEGRTIALRADGDWSWLIEDDIPIVKRNLLTKYTEYRNQSQQRWLRLALEEDRRANDGNEGNSG